MDTAPKLCFTHCSWDALKYQWHKLLFIPLQLKQSHRTRLPIPLNRIQLRYLGLTALYAAEEQQINVYHKASLNPTQRAKGSARKAFDACVLRYLREIKSRKAWLKRRCTLAGCINSLYVLPVLHLAIVTWILHSFSIHTGFFICEETEK